MQVVRKKVFISDFFKKKNKTPEEATYIGCEDVEEAVCQIGTPIQVYSGLVEPEQIRSRSLSKLVINWFIRTVITLRESYLMRVKFPALPWWLKTLQQ